MLSLIQGLFTGTRSRQLDPFLKYHFGNMDTAARRITAEGFARGSVRWRTEEAGGVQAGLTCSCFFTRSFFWASVTRSSSLRRSSWLTPSLDSSALASAWFSSCSSCSLSALPPGDAGTTVMADFSSSLVFSRSSWADRACGRGRQEGETPSPLEGLNV